jgi:hypothetical protein
VTLQRFPANRHYALWVSSENRAWKDMSTEKLLRFLANPCTVASATVGFVLATVLNLIAG